MQMQQSSPEVWSLPNRRSWFSATHTDWKGGRCRHPCITRDSGSGSLWTLYHSSYSWLLMPWIYPRKCGNLWMLWTLYQSSSWLMLPWPCICPGNLSKVITSRWDCGNLWMLWTLYQLSYLHVMWSYQRKFKALRQMQQQQHPKPKHRLILLLIRYNQILTIR